MDDEAFLLKAIELAAIARARGDHPFAALLVDPDGTVALTAQNTVDSGGDPTGHAEINLVRAAARQFDIDVRRTLTLYTSTEPCAMCAGAIYWAGITTVVFALSEADLRSMTGDDPKNPSLDLPCREVFARGAHPTTVRGPFMMPAAHEVHTGFWQGDRSPWPDARAVTKNSDPRRCPR